MKAPIKRVLPTPVARAKHTDRKSLSKSVTDGNSLWIDDSAAATSVSFLGGTIGNPVEDFQRQPLGRTQAEAACNRIYMAIHRITDVTLLFRASAPLVRADSQLDF